MTAKTVAVVQSCYIPWKGYFDLINSVDEFILYDDMQYTRRDWRNRNRIKAKAGLQWLTIPVQVKGRYYQRIRETLIGDRQWPEKHLETLRHSYGRAPYFREYEGFFADLYARASQAYLSEVNHHFLQAICRLLGIQTTLSWSSDYVLAEGKTERLVQLCKQAGATRYLSGPSARDYLDEGLFAAEGIGVSYMDYAGYPEYRQLYPPFEHAVSIVDLIFHTGPDARRYMKSL
jgi:hypothetical protein